MFDDPTFVDPSLSGNDPPPSKLAVFKKGEGLQISFPVGSQFSKTFAYTPISTDASNLRFITNMTLPCAGIWAITATVNYNNPYLAGSQTKAMKFLFAVTNSSSCDIRSVNGVIVDRTIAAGDSYLNGVWATYSDSPSFIRNFCFVYKNTNTNSLPQSVNLMGQIYTDPYNSAANITGTVSWTRIL